jgi:hypothetical protein
MKKSTNKTSRSPKLVLRREAVALLTPAQLGHVDAGGTASDWEPCRSLTFETDPAG